MKTKRYWLRGGLIGLAVSIIVFFYSLLNTVHQCKPNGLCPSAVKSFFNLFPQSLFSGSMGEYYSYLFIPLTVGGCIAGYIYGKNKHGKLQ